MIRLFLVVGVEVNRIIKCKILIKGGKRNKLQCTIIALYKRLILESDY